MKSPCPPSRVRPLGHPTARNAVRGWAAASSIVAAAGLLAPMSAATAAEWTIAPDIRVGAHQNDNARLSESGNEVEISGAYARIGALAGNDPEADCAIQRGLGERATAGDLARINTVQINNADNSTGAQGATNTATYQVGQDPTLCSVPAQPSDGWTVNSSAYPPLGRNVTVGPSSQLDIIGVRITLDRSWVTNFPPFSGPMQVNETTITRLEPGVFE